MNWDTYLTNRFKTDFFDNQSNALTSLTEKFFNEKEITDDVYNSIHYTNMLFYYGYQNNPQMSERYNRIPKEKNIDLNVWEKIKIQMEKVPPFYLHRIYENISDICFFEIVIKDIMELGNVDWDTAAKYLSESALYEIAEANGMIYMNHYSGNRWAKRVLNLQ